MTQAAQGGGGVNVPGGIQEPCACGTWTVGMLGMGWGSDWVLLNSFSNLSDITVLKQQLQMINLEACAGLGSGSASVSKNQRSAQAVLSQIPVEGF